MDTKTLIGVVFFIAALLLFYLSYKGLFNNNIIGQMHIDKVSGFISMLVAIVTFMYPSAEPISSKETNINSSNTHGDNSPININSPSTTIGPNTNLNIAPNSAAAIGTNPQINIKRGDETNTAKNRYQQSLITIREEFVNNFTQLFGLITAMNSVQPTGFYDVRKPNETEQTYQERAKNDFRDYISFVEKNLALAKFSKAGLLANESHIGSFKANELELIKRSYVQQETVIDQLQSYINNLQNILSRRITDSERLTESTHLYCKHLIDAKLALITALDTFSVIAEPSDMELLQSFLPLLAENQTFILRASKEGLETKNIITALITQKEKAIAELYKIPPKAREIDRIINDPYLINIRKSLGLPETLKESEIYVLERKEPDTTLHNLEDLLTAASFAYLELDGNASIFYLEKALKDKDLTELQKNYINASLDRLKRPNNYEESIGLLVLELEPQGNLAKSKIQVGDIIIKLNNKPINEPFDIATTLAKVSKDAPVVTIIRNEEKKMVKLFPHKSAGVKLSPLIMFNAVKL